MLALLVELAAFALCVAQLVGACIILALADNTRQIPLDPNSPILIKGNYSAPTVAALTSPTLMQANNPKCRETSYRNVFGWVIADAVFYTAILFYSVRRITLRMRRQRAARAWLEQNDAAAAAAAVEMQQVRAAPVVPVAANARANAPPLDPLGNPFAPDIPVPRPEDDQPQHLHRAPPNLPPAGPSKNPLAPYQILFWPQHLIIPFYAVHHLNYTAMDTCKLSAPIVHQGFVAVVIVLWVQFVLSLFVIPVLRKREVRRAITVGVGLGHGQPTYGTDRNGRPVRPPFVQLRAYVSSITEWTGTTLPYTPREIPPGPDGSPPECPICYDEFREPFRAIMGGRPLEWDADPLWALPCGHIFHEHCCAEWFAVANGQANGTRCPYCNQDARTTAPVAEPLAAAPAVAPPTPPAPAPPAPATLGVSIASPPPAYIP